MGGGDGDGDFARALVDLGLAEAGLPFPLLSVPLFGTMSECEGPSGLALALSSISGAMGETCWDSVGGRARGDPGVRRAETDFCSSISTSESMMRCYYKAE